MKYFIFSIVLCSSFGDLNGQAYFLKRNIAEKALVEENYTESLENYFDLYRLRKNKMFSTDAFNGILCSMKCKEMRKAKKFARVLALHGVNSDIIINKFPEFKENFRNRLDLFYQKGLRIRGKSEVSKKLLELYILDQKLEHGDERKKIFKIFKDSLLSYLDKGLINPLLVGVVLKNKNQDFSDNWPAIPLFHYSIENNFTTQEISILLKSIKFGNIKPEFLFSLENENINGYTTFDSFPFFFSINNNFLELFIEDDSETDLLYKSLMAHNLNDMKKIVSYHFCQENKMKLQFRGSGIGVLSVVNEVQALEMLSSFKGSNYRRSNVCWYE